MAELDTGRVEAPRAPQASPPYSFPVLATVAPVIAAVAIWLVTNSPFALIFAALGPVTALASLADSGLRARRTGRREIARFRRDAAATREAIVAAHELERNALTERAPAARELIARRGADPYRWRADSRAAIPVTIGTGGSRSSLQLDRAAPQPDDSAEVLATLDELESQAARLHGPVIVDARLGIGVVGSRPLAAAVARALALQVAWALPPERYWCLAPDPERAWVELLPHRVASVGQGMAGAIRFGQNAAVEPDVVIAAAESEAELPGACAVVVRAGGADEAAILQHPDRTQRRAVRLEAISFDEARDWAAAATLEAEREGLVAGHSALPALVAVESLPTGAAGGGLSACFAVDGLGPIVVDLVGDGPHAVVGGTTGSGKSELLVSWVLAMATAHPPEAVTFLLIDFKGGSAFDSLTALPHTAGIVTDLDEERATRALESLRAELRHRERTLASSGARSIEESRELPRLVIVVDEFAAMLSEHPGLHALFSDIAARGRSLGVHLILCTQRPAGVVRDAVLANADLRISLRVNNRDDSLAVVGVDAAAEIAAQARGRGILRRAGHEPTLVQFAIAGSGEAERTAQRWPDSPAIRRPWCDPLAAIVPLDEVPPSADAIVFGLSDLPREQRIGSAAWSPRSDGHLLVLGGPASGKTVALDAISSRGNRVLWLPVAVDAAWDVLIELAGRRDELVLVDDLDSLLARLPGEHRSSFVERFGELLRDGPSRGIHVAAAAQRLAGDLTSLAGLIPSRLLLAHPSRQDFVLAGGEGSHFLPKLEPGGALWRGDRVQVGIGAPTRQRDAPARVSGPTPGRHLAIVSSRAATLARPLSALGEVIELAASREDLATALATASQPAVILGDVDEWQSRWGALGALRSVADILFEGCSAADFRALTRSRTLPPPLLPPSSSAPPGALCWRLEPDGTAGRVFVPFPPP